MAKITVDGRTYEVDGSQNLLQAVLSKGLNLPYFCWHPALGSVGSCRQCAVKQYKDENDTKGRIVMACMEPAKDGARISIDDEEVKHFRGTVIEWLMANHPHDCPICDEGGECHLQDMTVMSGHNYRRHRFKKRTFENQFLGPFLNHEMNRCIECYRCVRFYRDYAGGRDLNVFAAHDHVYFGRHEDGVLENEFSGNLAEVCPTGVFTDKTLKDHYTRKWDLQNGPSICVHCAVGCSTLVGTRYGSVRRILNRYHESVNGYFLCDRGRYGYEFVNGERRLLQPAADGTTCTAERALEEARRILGEAKGVLGIGSPRASLEANFALKSLVGAERFHAGFAPAERRAVGAVVEALRTGPAHVASLKDVRNCDAALVLGEDLVAAAPVLGLAVRRSLRVAPFRDAVAPQKIPDWNEYAVKEILQERKGPLFVAAPFQTGLDGDATETRRAAPADLARLGYAVAHAVHDSEPAVEGLTEEESAFVERVASALKGAQRPLVVSGTGCRSEDVVFAAAGVARALCAAGCGAEIAFSLSECNSLGLGLLQAKGLEEALQAVGRGEADTVVVLENDLYRRADAREAVDALFAKAHVIVLDSITHKTAEKAAVALPAAPFSETDATLVSAEGRAQRSYKAMPPDEPVRQSWRWLRDLGAGSWETFPEVEQAMAASDEVFGRVPEEAPPAEFRIAGEKIPRQPHRYSGRTAMLANVTVHEPKPPQDPDSPLSFSMEGFQGVPPAPLTPFFWAPGWNSVQSLTKFQEEVGGPMRGGDAGVRLLEAASKGKPRKGKVPAAFKPGKKGTVLLLGLPHAFGSEELSALSPSVASRAPQPYLALHPADAEALGLAAGEAATVYAGDASVSLPVVCRADLPRGVAGVPAGIGELPTADLPVSAEVSR